MGATKSWLEELTLAKLHRLAVLIGSPCSGTKAVRIDGVRHAISGLTSGGEDGGQLSKLSLLSIDMGIRNLAFAHFTAPVKKLSYSSYCQPTLQAWQRITVSQTSQTTGSPSLTTKTDIEAKMDDSTPRKLASDTDESFELIDYAKHAHTLITHLLQVCKPTQIIIERQRFRSGGQPGVQEWTIRVGVFEGMLYSVLRTLVEERSMQLSVEPIQPSRVNRYWHEGSRSLKQPSSKKMTGRDMKRAKIALVGDILDAKASTEMLISPHLQPLADDFVSGSKGAEKPKRAGGNNVSKMDDLADSLLQGLAWIDWQNNRRRIQSMGREAFDLNSS